MKKIFFLSLSLLSFLSLGIPLYAQSSNFNYIQPPFQYDISTLLKQIPNNKEEKKILSDTVYEIGNIIKSFVDSRSDGFSGFPAGSCTEYIARQRPELFVNPDGSRRMTGNAEDRLINAQRLGFPTGENPKQGAIAVYYEGKGARKYGHVAYVEQIQNNGTLIVSEMNYEQDYIVTWRVLKADLAAGYIY